MDKKIQQIFFSSADSFDVFFNIRVYFGFSRHLSHHRNKIGSSKTQNDHLLKVLHQFVCKFQRLHRLVVPMLVISLALTITVLLSVFLENSLQGIIEGNFTLVLYSLYVTYRDEQFDTECLSEIQYYQT